MRRDAFYSVHPAVSFAFFAAVMLVTAFVLHPVVTGASLAASCAYTVFLKGRRSVPFLFGAVVPFIIIVAALNPLFNHAGVTPLFYLWNGNAVTLEAVIYGAVSSCMFAALILWCSCMNSVMSSDKYVHLFGRIIPVLSLVFSMVLRFVPRFFARIKQVSNAQAGLSKPFGKNPLKAVSLGLGVISATVTWALEGGVTMADSMKSRGYGLPGRTSYSLFRFDRRDVILSVLFLALLAAAVVSAACGGMDFRFYPSIKYSGFGLLSAMGCAAFALLTLTPVLMNIVERIRWQTSVSRI